MPKQPLPERYTKFAGVARLIVTELEKSFLLPRAASPQQEALVKRDMSQIIARCMYDHLYFLLDQAPYHSGSFDVGHGTPEEIQETIKHLPDLKKLPPAL